jgi:hypothetical protein
MTDTGAGDWRKSRASAAAISIRSCAPDGLVDVERRHSAAPGGQCVLRTAVRQGKAPPVLQRDRRRDPINDGSTSLQEMLEEYFDTSAFQHPGVGIVGNSARSNASFGAITSARDLRILQMNPRLEF